MKNPVKGIVFDFDGVLKPIQVGSQVQNFWFDIDHTYPNFFQHIQSLWEDTTGLEMIREWRRGNKTSQDICNYLADKYHVNANVLLHALHASVKKWYLDHQLISFSQHLRSAGFKTAIFTEHMDVFLDIIVPYFKLSNNFDNIICSSEYHMLKDENTGAFLDIVPSVMHIPMENLLFIDDWDKVCALAISKGATAYHYRGPAANADALLQWFQTQYGYVT